MKILLCNDDGIESEGLRILAETLSAKNEVFIVAPDGNRSACSHTLTVRDSIAVSEYSGIKGCKAFAISGTPADCVKVAYHVFSDFVPDVVVSGINKGHNLASDIMYSGTVAIAYEAAYFGYTAVAFSAFSHGESDFKTFAYYAESILYELVPISHKGQVWNVNFPDVGVKIAGRKFTPLGKRVYKDKYVIDSEGKYKLFGTLKSEITEEDCDLFWINRGYVTITPLIYDKSDYEVLKNMVKDK